MTIVSRETQKGSLGALSPPSLRLFRKPLLHTRPATETEKKALMCLRKDKINTKSRPNTRSFHVKRNPLGALPSFPAAI